jgi:peroxiredoxin
MKRLIISIFFGLFAATIVRAQEAPEGLFINSKAPDFKGKDQNGVDIRLKDLLKKGKVVLVFYRGNWCPFCNKELKALADSLQLIKAKGATLIAVTPEQQEGIKKTIENTKAEFSIISDEQLKIMKAYEVEFELSEVNIKRYKNGGIDINENNGKNGAFLPIPAVYVINKESSIVYRFFNADYKKRPTVAEILTVLDKEL